MTVISPLTMNFAVLTCAVGAMIFIMAAIAAPWRQLLALQLRQHLWLASIYALCITWSFIKVSLGSDIIAHPLLITACSIVFGFPLTLACGMIALLINQFIVDANWYNTGFNYLVSVVVPCGVTALVLFVIAKINIRNLFIFILGGGFVGGMLAIIASGMVALTLLWLFQPDLFNATNDAILAYVLLIYPEGFANGVIVISLAVMKPDLVKTYNDRFYIDGDTRDN
jgi:uncharacterized membrane protein